MLAYTLSVVAAVGVVALAALLFRSGGEDRDPGGPSAGHAGAMLSALFLLVFAIAIIVPWTTADAARQNARAESQSAVNAYWAADGLPGTAPEAVRAGLRDYVTFVVKDEWPLMGDGKMDPVGAARLDALRSRVMDLKTEGDAEQDARNSVLDHLTALADARSQRAADAAATPPGGLIVLTALTGVAVIVFPFLAGARPRGITLAPLVAMAAMLGFGVYLTWDMTHAFAGPLAVGPEAFEGALREFSRIAGGM
ncbi:DUF4239 domain-containing protein [Nonomuraea pusilla]|uniref:bestrophin-like domain n=1 Tax=Nonomuraea pusilla TaxID=46177 RepID=UPI00332A4401